MINKEAPSPEPETKLKRRHNFAIPLHMAIRYRTRSRIPAAVTCGLRLCLRTGIPASAEQLRGYLHASVQLPFSIRQLSLIHGNALLLPFFAFRSIIYSYTYYTIFFSFCQHYNRRQRSDSAVNSRQSLCSASL